MSKNKLKYIRSLHTSKYRQKYNNFIVEGHKSCIEFLKAGIFEVEELVSTDKWYQTHKEHCSKINESKINIADSAMIGEASQFKSAPEVMLILKQQHATFSQIIEADGPIFLVDDVQDPGNLGTIIRIADWFGFYGVLRTIGSADFYNGKVVQSSMGSLNSIKIGILEDLNLLPWDRVVALDMAGQKIENWEPGKKQIVVMGNEGNGVSKELLASAKQVISIPGSVHRVAESLNVGVTAGIVANHIFAALSKK
ncbi:MAG TPA: TrmH family RNA methyltransferase [Saprospiraceae bacterium]|nr:TrmH family RNA methyltransferase [Saprospiraceae bacterium]HPN71061.1 TrmH family RNA methyltransferase [Saprospiraceae bacterium]